MSIRSSMLVGIGTALLTGLAAGGFSHWRYTAGEGHANSEWQAKWNQRDAKDARALAERQAETRAEEQRRQNTINQVTENARKQLSETRTAAAAAQSAADGLRHTLSDLQQQYARSEAARHSAVAAERQARADTRILLARLFSESVERNRQLAAYADRARIKGQTCEKAYDALSGSAPPPENPRRG